MTVVFSGRPFLCRPGPCLQSRPANQRTFSPGGGGLVSQARQAPARARHRGGCVQSTWAGPRGSPCGREPGAGPPCLSQVPCQGCPVLTCALSLRYFKTHQHKTGPRSFSLVSVCNHKCRTDLQRTCKQNSNVNGTQFANVTPASHTESLLLGVAGKTVALWFVSRLLASGFLWCRGGRTSSGFPVIITSRCPTPTSASATKPSFHLASCCRRAVLNI